MIIVLTVFTAALKQFTANIVALLQVGAVVVQLTSASIGPRLIVPFMVTEHSAANGFSIFATLILDSLSFPLSTDEGSAA